MKKKAVLLLLAFVTVLATSAVVLAFSGDEPTEAGDYNICTSFVTDIAHEGLTALISRDAIVSVDEIVISLDEYKYYFGEIARFDAVANSHVYCFNDVLGCCETNIVYTLEDFIAYMEYTGGEAHISEYELSISPRGSICASCNFDTVITFSNPGQATRIWVVISRFQCLQGFSWRNVQCAEYRFQSWLQCAQCGFRPNVSWTSSVPGCNSIVLQRD